jgi:ubiquinone/menaquinone biosynthesis C-methylase UbiE
MTSQRTISKNLFPSSLGSLLKHYAATYDTLAPEYDEARFGDRPGRYDFEETRIMVRSLVSILRQDLAPDWLALDLASGTGKIATAIGQAGGKVIALDASRNMLQQCLANARVLGVDEKIFPMNASADHLPFSNGVFDAVFSFRFLHLLPQETYANLLREMVRVVKPGGHVVIEVKNRRYGGGVYRVKDWLHFLGGATTFSSYATSKQLHDLEESLGEASLHSITGTLLPKGWWVMGYPPLARMLRGLAGGLLRGVSAHLVTVYQKELAVGP